MTPTIAQPAVVRGRQPVQRFRPTSGAFVGWAGVVLALTVLVWVCVAYHSLIGLRWAAASLLAAVLVWMTQLRPRVTAYDDGLLLQGIVRDTFVPYVVIDEVVLRQTLDVWAGGRRYVCVGIGRNRRADLRAGSGVAPPGVAATRGYHVFGGPSVGQGSPSPAYHQFIVDRITGLVTRAHELPPPEDPPPVRYSLAALELAVAAIAAAALVVTLLL